MVEARAEWSDILSEKPIEHRFGKLHDRRKHADVEAASMVDPLWPLEISIDPLNTLRSAPCLNEAWSAIKKQQG